MFGGNFSGVENLFERVRLSWYHRQGGGGGAVIGDGRRVICQERGASRERRGCDYGSNSATAIELCGVDSGETVSVEATVRET